MFNKLEKIVKKYDELAKEASDPKVIANNKEYGAITKEMSLIEDARNHYLEYKRTENEINDILEMLKSGLDDDEKEMFENELNNLNEKKTKLVETLKNELAPKDPKEDKNVIIEIRAGTGGEEASLFGADLMRMYLRFAERMGFKAEILETQKTGLSGIKEASMLIKGKGAYSYLKFEGGVHRVQRVPETESSGRLHTSAATVAVLLEATEVDVNIDPNDVRVDVYRSSGNGGQSVNTTDSAVRLTHIPTGLVVTCQDEKSQIKNKDKAFKVLRARLYELELQKIADEESENRKSMVGSGDRSERIRTYNFPQNRISDHRINFTSYKLNDFIDGDINELVDALRADQRAKQMIQND